MGPATHTEASPSKFKRIALCVASVVASRGISDTPSAAATKGTLLHGLAEYCLKAKLETKDLPTDGEWAEFTAEDRALVQLNLDWIRSVPGELIGAHYEQRVDLTEFYPGAGPVGGTLDVVLVTMTEGRRVLWLIDHKFGFGVVVDAEENEQLLGYAPAFISDLSPIYGDFDEVRLVILQPTRDHVSEWVTTPAYVGKWVAEKMAPALAAAFGPNPTFNPSADACQFCPARYQCEARNAAHLFELETAFNEAPVPDDATPEQIAAALARASTWSKWIDDMKAAAAYRLAKGEPIPGFKRVAGKSVRKWADDAQASEALVAALIDQGKDPDDAEAAVHSVKVIGIGDAEKLLGKKSPVIESLTVAVQQNPQVVVESDKRPAIQTADEMFPLSIEEL